MASTRFIAAGAAADGAGVAPDSESTDILVVARSSSSVGRLLADLRQRELRVDVAADLIDARRAFLAGGGHRLLVLAPDLAPGAARSVFDSLRAVDPALEVVAFGRDILREHRDPRLARAHSLHPDSRAGIGVVLKALRRL